MLQNSPLRPGALPFRRSPLRRIGVLTAGLVLVSGLAGTNFPGRATAQTSDDEALKSSWSTTMEARGVEAVANIPVAIVAGLPEASIDIYAPPTRCEATAAVYYAGSLAETAVLGNTGLYYNRTAALAKNPPTDAKQIGGAPERREKVEFAPTTAAGGPYALAECPGRSNGQAVSRMNGVSTPGLTIGTSFAESTERVDKDTIFGEAVSGLFNVKVGDALSIRSVHSTLKAEHQAGQEPKFTYTLSLVGISNGGTDALTISGKGTGAEIVKQFNEQAAANKEAFAALGTYDVFISEPRAFHDDRYGKTVFEAPAINLGAGIAARKGTAGDYQAVRFALTRYTGAHEVIGEPLPASPV